MLGNIRHGLLTTTSASGGLIAVSLQVASTGTSATRYPHINPCSEYTHPSLRFLSIPHLLHPPSSPLLFALPELPPGPQGPFETTCDPSWFTKRGRLFLFVLYMPSSRSSSPSESSHSKFSMLSDYYRYSYLISQSAVSISPLGVPYGSHVSSTPSIVVATFYLSATLYGVSLHERQHPPLIQTVLVR